MNTLFLAMAAINNTLHVSEYSEDGKLFALLNVEGKLKIWDTETGEYQKEYVPNYHLKAPFTCFTWITVNGSIGPRKVKIWFYFVINTFENRQFINNNEYFLLYLLHFRLLKKGLQTRDHPNTLHWEHGVVVSACILSVKAW